MYLAPFQVFSLLLLVSVLLPQTATADWLYMFFEVNCNPSGDTFTIRELSAYNDEGKQLMRQSPEMKGPPYHNGIYYTDGLNAYSDQNNPSSSNGKRFTTSCKLASGTFVADIQPSKQVTVNGRCGQAEPSVSLTLRRGKRYVVRDLVFDDSCHEPGVIESITIHGKRGILEVHGSYEFLTFPKTFHIIANREVARGDIFPKGPYGDLDTQLMLAIKKSRDNGDLKEVRNFIAKGANTNYRAQNGTTPLLEAFPDGNNALVELLIAKGADPNIADDYMQNTPLMLAALEWREDLIRLFIGHGADVHARDKFGRTALMMTMFAHGAQGSTFWPDHARALRALLEAGAELSAHDERGQTVASLAHVHGKQELLEWLKQFQYAKDTSVNAR